MGAESQPPANSKLRPTVVGIGASAGGLTALKTFFAHVPADSGLAFVVVVHLSPEYKSHMADLLQPHVQFPVQQVTDTTLLEENRVYIIPPNANLSAVDTHLRLSKLEEHRRERAPIDHFFRTLAGAHDGQSIGVILTGTGSDGTLGVKEIKARGGFIVVQDPNEAEFEGMPQSAISTGVVDCVLPVAEIPDAILRFSRTEPRLPVLKDEKEADYAARVLLPKVFALLRMRTHRDFSRYKQSTILRRLARRMQLNYVEDFEVYLQRVRQSPEEVHALADDLLITVTNFFRDPEAFEKLREDVLPKLFDRAEPRESIRVWSVGCATGEEPYSIAMLLLEVAARREAPPDIQIFASDLHKFSLDKAREGFYPGDIETDVSEERLRRFFQQENGGYRINKEVRDLVVFAPHNLLADPPFSRLDLISCRNLLIYLDREVQRDVIDLFHYALRPDGYLLLGSAETIDKSDLFRAEDKKACLYQKRNVPPPEPRLPVFPLTRGRLSLHGGSKSAQPAEPPSYGALHQRMVEQYAPPSILVNVEDRIVHVSEHAGRYLVHPGGELTTSILSLVREELRMELRTLIQEAREKRQARDSDPVTVRFNGDLRPVVLHVRPALQAPDEGFVLVIFDEREPRGGEAALVPATTVPIEVSAERRIRELEQEVREARHRLQAIVEECEASQEEMRGANEEMQSTNEELRSTMEELETSKAELQSINEELQAVNQENRFKVEELSQLSNDLHNFLSATDIATLFLDRELRILRFTPKLSELFNVRATDRGRPISDLTRRLGYPELREDARTVLRELIPIEREVRDEEGRWYLTRVLPYRSTDDRIEGVVSTFTDITSQKKVEQLLRTSDERFRSALAVDVVGVIFFQPGGQITWANDSFLRMSGFSKKDLDLGRLRWDSLTAPDSMQLSLKAMEEYLSVGCISPYEKELVRRDGSRWFGLVSGRRLNQDEGVEFIVDVTDRKRMQNALAVREREFNTIAELVPELVWKARPNGNTNWVNQRWYDFTGQSPEQPAASPWTSVLHPDDRDSLDRYMRAVGAERMFRRECRIRGADGNYRWFLIAVQPVHDESGTLTNWFGMATDIEHAHQTTEALKQSLAEKEALLKEVHHRVKNNLQVITSLLNLQARQIGEGNALAAFDEARNRVQSIASIHEFLYRSESLTAVELGAYARRLVPEIVRLYGVEDRIQFQVLGDGVSLEMERAVPFGLLLNELVSNVCKHAFPPGRRGTLTVGLDDEDHQIVMTVTDTGIGLPEGFNNLTASSVGTSLVNSLARQLGATVTFRSDRGTSVEVRMPRSCTQDTEGQP